MNKVEALPQLVDPTEFNLEDKKANQKLLNDLQSKSSKKRVGTLKLKDGSTVPIWNSGGPNDKGYFWIEFQNLIVWLVKFEVIHRAWLPKKYTTQVALWRGGTVILPSHTSSKLFFSIVFKRTGCMMSDRIQTVDGKRYWTARLGDAIGKGLKVALVDFSKKSIQELNSIQEIHELEDLAWGNMRSNQNLRWMIWK